ncbi:tellurium resistance protein [Caulobacter phage CcrSC]|uniref:Tellurium resistance protein n=1 Tax=Caulobacter phage CcrSC TaxID=2283272 RepID=A0A385EDU8_9CAUD|nr:tellurium resistance protein [Caulobacter phage CcrSC]AXQ69830.1 tellurium resistance protein [Caulobacter phage CcrSC]
MANLSVEKGERINIQKEAGGDTLFILGIGWTTEADLDSSVFLCKQQPNDEPAKCIGNPGAIYFGQLESSDRAIIHTGDNRTGQGNASDQDDERIILDLGRLTGGVDQLDLWVNIYDTGINFGSVKNAYCRLYKGVRDAAGNVALDENGKPLTGEVILRYDLTEDYSRYNALQFGSLYLKDNQWRFQALDVGQKATIKDIINSYLPGAVA